MPDAGLWLTPTPTSQVRGHETKTLLELSEGYREDIPSSERQRSRWDGEVILYG